jgi:hypothetical protein
MMSLPEVLLINDLYIIMQKRNICFVAIAFILFALSLYGCSPNSTMPLIPLKAGELTANVSGSGSFYASNTFTASLAQYNVRASTLDQNNTDSLVITLLITKGVPPYSVDVSTEDNSVISYCIVKPDGSCTTYTASKLNGGSGQINISSISPTLQGAFSGTLQLVGGSGSITISGGEFNSPYQ